MRSWSSSIDAAGPKQQVHDILLSERTEPAQDLRLARALDKSRNVTLAYLPRTGARDGHLQDIKPLPEFTRKARIGTIGLWYNYANEAWILPQGYRQGPSLVPSVATVLAGKTATTDATFRINYAFDPRTVPVLSAADVLAGQTDPALLSGKTVIVGITTERLGDQFMVPGWGKESGVYIHILGAETLKAGKPLDLGWLPAFFLAGDLGLPDHKPQRPGAGGRPRRRAYGLVRSAVVPRTGPGLCRRHGRAFCDCVAWLGPAAANGEAARPDQFGERPAQPRRIPQSIERGCTSPGRRAGDQLSADRVDAVAGQ